MKRLLLGMMTLLTSTTFSQTAGDPNAGLTMVRDPATEHVTLSWWGQSGRKYFVQQSEDLVRWHYLPLIEVGQDSVITWGLSCNLSRSFFKLTHTEQGEGDPMTLDTDGDGLDDWTEANDGTSPFQQDSDGDGWFDDEEKTAGTDGQDAQSKPELQPMDAYVEMQARAIHGTFEDAGGNVEHTFWRYYSPFPEPSYLGSWQIYSGWTQEITPYRRGSATFSDRGEVLYDTLPDTRAALPMIASMEDGWYTAYFPLKVDSSYTYTAEGGGGSSPPGGAYTDGETWHTFHQANGAENWKGGAMDLRLKWNGATPRPERLRPVERRFLKLTRENDVTQMRSIQVITLNPGQPASSSGGDGNNGIIGLRADTMSHGNPLTEALHPVDLDMVHPATGELDEAKQHDAETGGLVAVRRDDQTPVTKLVIRATDGLPAGSLYKLQYTQGDKYRIWKDAERTQAVTSGQTEFPPSVATTLYLEGLKRSTARGVEEITLQAVVEGVAIDAETVKLTVVEAEFDIVARAFIPYQWVAITHPVYPNVVAHGDDRDYDPELKGTYRMQNIVTVIPFEELSPSPIKHIKDGNGVLKPLQHPDCGETKHFDKATSLTTPGCAMLHEGEAACPTTRLTAAALSDEDIGLPCMVDKATASTDKMKTVAVSVGGHVGKVQINGSASEPIVIGAAPIDYSFDVEIDATDPLQPRYRLGGKQDGFPAYEVYVRAKKLPPGAQGNAAEVTAMYQWKPAPGVGVEQLLPVVGDVTISPAKEGDISLP